MSGGVWPLYPTQRATRNLAGQLSAPHTPTTTDVQPVSCTSALALALITRPGGLFTHPPTPSPKPWNAHSWFFLHTVKPQKTDEG